MNMTIVLSFPIVYHQRERAFLATPVDNGGIGISQSLSSAQQFNLSPSRSTCRFTVCRSPKLLVLSLL